MTLMTGDDGLPIVDLRFDSLRNLQEELGPYLALEGFFLRGETSVLPSDVIRFRMMLPGDFVLVEGAGVIIWVREADEAGPLDPVGAAVGFATLSEQGRELVERMVQTHIESGGRQFDLSRPAVSESQEADPDATIALRPHEEKAEEKSAFRFTVRGEETQASSLADSTAEAVQEKLEAPTGLDPEEPLVMDLPFEDAEPVVDPPPEPAPLAFEPVEEKSTAVSASPEETPGTTLDDEEDPAPEEFESAAEFELVEGSAEEEEFVGSGGGEPPSWSPPMAMPAEGVKPEIESDDVTRNPPDIVTLPSQEEIQPPEMAAPVRGFDIDLPTDSDSDLRTAERMGAGE
ncbi:MAG: hypothetical protein K8R59_18395, partial [Thermoanaerobaculales bacterium]|nr:hypothetical protein [Thermoanaerobaculales bacterium]